MIEHEALLRAQLAQEENGVVLSGRLVDVLVSHLWRKAQRLRQRCPAARRR